MKGHNCHGRGWVAAFAIVTLVVAHVALLRFAAGLHYSLLLAVGAIAIVVLKCGLSKIRR